MTIFYKWMDASLCESFLLRLQLNGRAEVNINQLSLKEKGGGKTKDA